MSLPDVTTDQILNAIQLVPTARWGEALRAIESLQSVPASTGTPAAVVRTGSDLRDSALIGIWADRADITDSREFARELRRRAEHRN
jgi:hypothetical protein